MTTAIIVLLSVAVAALLACLVVLIVAAWPRRSSGCPFLGRVCIGKSCKFWSVNHGVCVFNLVCRGYLDREDIGTDRTVARRYGLTSSDD